MSVTHKVLVRNAREQDIPAVVEIETEVSSAYGTAAQPETFQRRLTAFPDGFVILVAENEVAGYGSSEKWLTEREPGLDENRLTVHQPDGRILCITGLAVRTKYQGRGYRLRLLDRMIEIAHREGCRKIIRETAHAQDLYQGRGFQTVRNHMEVGISLDVMSLDIESYGSKA